MRTNASVIYVISISENISTAKNNYPLKLVYRYLFTDLYRGIFYCAMTRKDKSWERN